MIIKQLARWMVVSGLLIAAGNVAQAAPDGAELYAQQCASCHGADGRGGVGVPLALPAFLHNVDDDYLAHTIRQGRPGRVMPAFNELSDAQISAIVKHLRGFAPGQTPQHSDVVIQGNAKRGGQLYGKHCAACHGANGEGGKGTGVTFSRPRDLPIIAPALNNEGFLASASDALIKHTLINGREGTPMQSFIKQGLTDKDINDIVSYVRSFKPKKFETPAGEEPMLVMDSPYSLEKTVEQVKTSAMAANYKIIRIQKFEQGLAEKGKEGNDKVIVYFCNFPLLNEMLTIDPRVGLFLPCRVTVVEREGKVQVMSINPRYLSAFFNNAELDKACDTMHGVYTTILEEATL